MFHATRPVLTAAAGLFLFAGLARGQDQQPAQPLSGPKVREHKIPGVHETFGDAGKDANAKKDARSIPPDVIKRAIGALSQDDTPADARLTDGQRAKIDGLVSEFQASVVAYKEAHKAEMAGVRKVLGDEGAGPRPERPKGKRSGGDKQTVPPKPGENPPRTPSNGDAKAPAAPAADSEQVAAARAKLAELRKNAPDSLALQTQVWNILSEPQHAIVQAEVDKWIKSREQEQARDYVHKRLNKKGGPGDQAGPRIGADGALDLNSLPPKLKERLEKMTPEEREKALARIRERIKNGDAPNRRGKKGASSDGEPKPPPPMGDVPVPPPENPPGR